MRRRAIAAGQEEGGQRPRRGAILGAFAGLLPPLLALLPFALGRWGAGLAVYLVGSLLLVGYRLARHARIDSLDACSLAVGVLLALGYLGFGATFFLQRYGAVIAGLLLAQVLHGELRGEPWTLQYARRMYPPAAWQSRAFVEGNRFVSRLWGTVFVVAVLLSAVGQSPLLRLVLPNVLLLVAAALTRPAAHWYGRRYLPTAGP